MYGHWAEDGSALDAVVLGEVANGKLLEFVVPDRDAAYTVSLLEVAGADNALRSSLEGYSVRLRKN